MTRQEAIDFLVIGESMKYTIEDYNGIQHKVNHCPSCGGAPERLNGGPELQGVMCFKCGVSATYTKEIGSNAMLVNAIREWNEGNFIVNWRMYENSSNSNGCE